MCLCGSSQALHGAELILTPNACSLSDSQVSAHRGAQCTVLTVRAVLLSVPSAQCSQCSQCAQCSQCPVPSARCSARTLLGDWRAHMVRASVRYAAACTPHPIVSRGSVHVNVWPSSQTKGRAPPIEFQKASFDIDVKSMLGKSNWGCVVLRRQLQQFRTRAVENVLGVAMASKGAVNRQPSVVDCLDFVRLATRPPPWLHARRSDRSHLTATHESMNGPLKANYARSGNCCNGRSVAYGCSRRRDPGGQRGAPRQQTGTSLIVLS